MSSKFFSGEEMLEAGISTVKKQVNTQITATGKSISTQLGTNTTKSTPENLSNQANSTQAANVQDQAAKDFVKDLYGASDQNSPDQALAQSNSTHNQTTANLTLQGKSINAPKSQDEAEKLALARKALMEQHMSTYYKPTFEAPKPAQEETAEKLDREKQEEEAKKMEELQIEQKKNEVPMAIRMGAQKAEKFRGAAG